MKNLVTSSVVGLGLGLAILSAAAFAAEPKKLAFLVGVAEYQSDELPNLNYADEDVEALRDVLATHGFEVDTLLRDEATGEAIQERFSDFLEKTSDLDKEDIVLVGLFGHGVQHTIDRDGARVVKAYFCPYDAVKTDVDTLVSVDDLINGLHDFSACSHNLLVIDAARNDPAAGDRGIDGGSVRDLPSDVSALFACSPGGQSFESGQVKHGVFAHVLLEGLQGEAADKRGVVTWLTLANYATTEVPRQARELLEDDTLDQRPNLVGNFTSAPVLARVGASPALLPPATKPEPKPMPTATAKPASTPPKPESPKPESPQKPEEEFTNSVGMKLLLIPAGEFVMGSQRAETAADKDELPEHRVRISRPFFLGQTEVTQGQWFEVMKSTPWAKNIVVQQGRDFPAVYVSHDDAVAFCTRLGQLDGNKYRLPSEAEWEYACRAGTTTRYAHGDDDERLSDYGWMNVSTIDFTKNFSRQVGQKKPNAWKLHDMHGNVYEWCRDWYDEGFYAVTPLQDPRGPEQGTHRVLRGGSYSASEAKYCRSANRYSQPPTMSYDNIGFRVVCER